MDKEKEILSTFFQWDGEVSSRVFYDERNLLKVSQVKFEWHFRSSQGSLSVFTIHLSFLSLWQWITRKVFFYEYLEEAGWQRKFEDKLTNLHKLSATRSNLMLIKLKNSYSWWSSRGKSFPESLEWAQIHSNLEEMIIVLSLKLFSYWFSWVRFHIVAHF